LAFTILRVAIVVPLSFIYFEARFAD
jgi:hypothetical protein